MAASFDAYFEDGATGAAGAFSFTSGSGNVAGSIAANSNRVLIAALVSRTNGVATVSVTWDGVAMTPIGTKDGGASLGYIAFFGLSNPNTGSKVLSATWTGGTEIVSLHGWSLYNANGWQNFTTNDAGTTSTALSTGAVTSANGNLVCAAAFDNDASSGTFSGSATSDVRDGRFTGNYHGAHQASTSGSTTLSGTLGSAVWWITGAVDVIAAGGSGNIVINFPDEL